MVPVEIRVESSVDHVPIILALTDGEVVGARPLFALEMAINGEREVALQPGDAMVHPDHRRQGLFSRMMEEMIERYSVAHPFYFTFPNKIAGNAHRKLGARDVSKRSTYYRVQNPAALTTSRADRRTIRFLSSIATPVLRGYARFRDRFRSVSPGVTRRRKSDPPAKELAALYRQFVPAAIHVIRDVQFYQWRYENPDWEYTTHLAEGDAGRGAAIVTGTAVCEGPEVTKLIDVVSLQNANTELFEALLDRIVTDHPETDLFMAPGQGLPRSVLGRFAFHSDSSVPISLVGTQTRHLVVPFDDTWECHGVDITDSDNWLLTLIERDTN